MSTRNRAYRLVVEDQIARKDTKLCLGIDPNFRQGMLPFMQQQREQDPAQFLDDLCGCWLDAAKDHVVAVKFQSSFFEALGVPGWEALRRAIQKAQGLGLPVIWDAKRGDISSTMEAYGQVCFDQLHADSMTITPYMGSDVITALGSWLEQGRLVYVVFVPSNPSGKYLWEAQGSQPVIAQQVWQMLLDCRQNFPQGLGFVVGATILESLPEELWQEVVQFPLLVPGLGFQGAPLGPRLRQLQTAKVPHLLPMSRGLTGVGDPSLVQNQDLKSWKDYRQWVQQRIEKVSHDSGV